MKQIPFAPFLLVLTLCASLVSIKVLADDDKSKGINKAQAAQQAQKVANGRVLKVDQNKNQYRVKVLQKTGRVVSVDVDKKSGKVSKPKG